MDKKLQAELEAFGVSQLVEQLTWLKAGLEKAKPNSSQKKKLDEYNKGLHQLRALVGIPEQTVPAPLKK